jgi:ElaB/YqjD/DUF883 family membrane-anchored ribosome-binding protein
MSDAQSEISELLALQREAQALRPEPERAAKAPAEAASPPVDGDADDNPVLTEIQKSMNELSENIENAVHEIETAAKEQPVLTALVAFTLGLVVGQLSSRR